MTLWNAGGLLEKFQHIVEEKNVKIECIEQGKRDSLFYSHLPSSKTAQVRVKRDLHGPHYSPEGKSEPMFEQWVLWFCEMFSKRSTSFLPHPGHWAALPRRAGRTGRTVASTVRGHQRIPSLLTPSQTPSWSLSMSFWGSPQLAHRHPQCSEHDTITLHLHPVTHSLSPTRGQQGEPL